MDREKAEILRLTPQYDKVRETFKNSLTAKRCEAEPKQKSKRERRFKLVTRSGANKQFTCVLRYRSF